MQKLLIHSFGPIQHCEMEIKKFIFCTGAQASGKSTVAKNIFFFKNIRNLLFLQMKKRIFLHDLLENSRKFSVKKALLKEIRSNFLQVFGTTWHMDMNMRLEYDYSEQTFIHISLREGKGTPNYIWVEFSDDLESLFEEFDRMLLNTSEDLADLTLKIHKRVNEVFQDKAEVVYIPAGRSMITLLSTQLNYIYSSMDDLQKRSMDYCTQNYLERILQLKSVFTQSPAQMLQEKMTLTDQRIDKERLWDAIKIMTDILEGEYRNVNGEERLQISSEKYVKINFASSGQQEVLWILNVLFYYLLNNRNTYYIIEEPESHLFPDAQKLITEFIILVCNKSGNQLLVTTHSPYILGTVNNLLYANKISKSVDQHKLEFIVKKNKWISFCDLAAYYIENGKVSSCTDEEFESLKNEVIDGASEKINRDFDYMIRLEEEGF